MTAAVVDLLGRLFRPGDSADDGDVFEPPSADAAREALRDDDDLTRFGREARNYWRSIGHEALVIWGRWCADPERNASLFYSARLTAYAMRDLRSRERDCLTTYYRDRVPCGEWGERAGMPRATARSIRLQAIANLGAALLAYRAARTTFKRSRGAAHE